MLLQSVPCRRMESCPESLTTHILFLTFERVAAVWRPLLQHLGAHFALMSVWVNQIRSLPRAGKWSEGLAEAPVECWRQS